MVNRYFASIWFQRNYVDVLVLGESPVLTLSSQVTESSHSEVVKQIQLGSYVALTVVHASRF